MIPVGPGVKVVGRWPYRCGVGWRCLLSFEVCSGSVATAASARGPANTGYEVVLKVSARPNSQAKLLRLPSLRNRRASQHCTAAVIGIISPKSHPCTLVPQKMFDNRSSSRFSFRLDTRIPEKEALNMKFF
ncbi:hypothetical protein PGTUg99_027020 [Puccinia graminis f. sp. tritici]|uniref:Uncharacterized protein n=1 Tax=Puccinia graminis f. sp. tritici TaxID=56615 RepID=A0A5B0N0L7_PUCGR|nr:hypothetical protein PGTUg99_027020 [Puccinia graminis f. sp. tritici]